MLENLIVLGQVPGTHIQLTFLEIYLSCYFYILAIFWRHSKSYARMDRTYLAMMKVRRLAKNQLRQLGYSDGIMASPYSLSSSKTYFSDSEMLGRLAMSDNREKYLAI